MDSRRCCLSTLPNIVTIWQTTYPKPSEVFDVACEDGVAADCDRHVAHDANELRPDGA